MDANHSRANRLHHQHGKCLLCYVTLWLAMSQPFGLRMPLGVPQKHFAC